MPDRSDQTAAEITDLLNQWADGDRTALDALIPQIGNELRLIARRHMRGEPENHTLQTTALVHEAYLRLLGQHPIRWQNRAQFFAMAARLMRRILVDNARRKQAAEEMAGWFR